MSKAIRQHLEGDSDRWAGGLHSLAVMVTVAFTVSYTGFALAASQIKWRASCGCGSDGPVVLFRKVGG